MERNSNLIRWWPLALLPGASALLFAGYGATRAEGSFDWTLPALGLATGVVAFGVLLAIATWRRGRHETDTHERPMRLIESPVIWVPPLVLIALVLTFVLGTPV